MKIQTMVTMYVKYQASDCATWKSDSKLSGILWHPVCQTVTKTLLCICLPYKSCRLIKLKLHDSQFYQLYSLPYRKSVMKLILNGAEMWILYRNTPIALSIHTIWWTCSLKCWRAIPSCCYVSEKTQTVWRELSAGSQ